MELTTSIPEGNSPSTTCRVFRLTAKGLPGPKGSRNVGKNGGTYEQSKIATRWQKDVALQVRSEMARVGLTTLAPPYAVGLDFFFTKPDNPIWDWPTKGDIDKFARSTLDALQVATAILEDKHVTRLAVSKDFVAGPPGAHIYIESLAP